MLAVIAQGCRDQGKSRSDIFMKLEFMSSLVVSTVASILTVRDTPMHFVVQ